MAKRRSKKTRKTARPTTRATAKRGGARKTRKPRPRLAKSTPAPKNGLDLKKLRNDLERAVAALGRKATRDPMEREAIDGAQERMTRWIAEADQFCTEEMQAVCGPTMEIEF